MPTRRSSAISIPQALLVAIIVVVSSFGVGLTRLAWTDHNLRALEAEEQARVDTLTAGITDLDKQIALARTDDFVRDWARRVMKQTQAGEVPVVLVVPQAAPPPPQPLAKPASPPSTQTEGIPRWRALLDQLWRP